MATQPLSPKTPPARRTVAAPEQLLKQLLAHAADPSGDGPPDDGSRAEEVLLDMDLDGARYLLLRLPKPGRRACYSARGNRRSSEWWLKATAIR